MIVYGYIWLWMIISSFWPPRAFKGLPPMGVDQEKTKTLGPHVFSVKASNWCMETMEEI